MLQDLNPLITRVVANIIFYHFLQSEGSTQAIQFKWAQERRVDGYNITDKTLDRYMSHVIAESGWILHNSLQLTAGRKYTYEVRFYEKKKKRDKSS